MLQEFALDPDAIEDLKDLRLAEAIFSLGKGKAIGELPSSWRAEIAARLGCTGKIDDKRVEELLVRIKSSMLPHPAPTAHGFLGQAKDEDSKHPFQAILTLNLKDESNRILPFSELLESKLWMDAHSLTWRRSPGSIRQHLRLFASLTDRLHLVDPYLDLRERRYRDFLVPLLELILQAKGAGAPRVNINLHTRKQFSDSFKPEEWKRAIPVKQLWSPMNFFIHFWDERTFGDRFHNRYLLNNKGGFQFGDGLEASQGSSETDSVHVLGPEHYSEIWNKFASRSSPNIRKFSIG